MEYPTERIDYKETGFDFWMELRRQIPDGYEIYSIDFSYDADNLSHMAHIKGIQRVIENEPDRTRKETYRTL